MNCNHREFERIPANHPVKYRVPGTEREGAGRIRDVSGTGVRIDTDAELAPATALTIRIEALGGGAPPLLRPATVVRCAPAASPPGYTIACAFD